MKQTVSIIEVLDRIRAGADPVVEAEGVIANTPTLDIHDPQNVLPGIGQSYMQKRKKRRKASKDYYAALGSMSSMPHLGTGVVGGGR